MSRKRSDTAALWWRTLAPLPLRSHADRGANELRKRLWGPVLPGLVAFWQRQGAHAAGSARVAALEHLGAALEATPPPDAAPLLAGRLLLAGREVGSFPPASWQLPSARPLEVYEAHYLDWADTLVADALASVAPLATDALARIAEALSGWTQACAQVAKAWEPYPRARRVLACLRAASRLAHVARHGRDRMSARHLALQTELLTIAAAAAASLDWMAERHLGGNHLLVDRIAAAAAAAVFGGEVRACAALQAECARQFSPDGSHVEGSAMYHAMLTEDLLVLRHLLPDARQPSRRGLDPVVARACAWLGAVRHPDGRLPAFGDSDPDALDHLPLTRTNLGSVQPGPTDPRASAWTSRQGGHVAIVHSAPPAYAPQPGHAHADQLSLEWSWRDTRILADAGLGGYEGDANRDLNRSAASHSVLDIAGHPSVELWSTFRVGARGRFRHMQWGQLGPWHWIGAIFEWPSATHQQARLIAHSAEGRLVLVDGLRADQAPREALGRLLLAPGVTPSGARSLICPAGVVRIEATTSLHHAVGIRFSGRGQTQQGPELHYEVRPGQDAWIQLAASDCPNLATVQGELGDLWRALAAQMRVG